MRGVSSLAVELLGLILWGGGDVIGVSKVS